MGRLTLLVTSPRVAPGLLSRPAWQALDDADAVLAGDDPHDQAPALAASGTGVEVLDAGDPAVLARELVARAAAASSGVVWLSSADGDPGLTDALAVELSRVAGSQDPPEVEVLVGSHDVPGARLLDVVAVMDRLRSPGGCPWDAKQTHETLVPYLVEEAFETAEAIETGDRVALREELGDVLLQVAFHSRVAQEHPSEPFDVDDVAAGIVAKLVSRHPHVFAADGEPGADASTAEEVQSSWDRLKAAEKGRDSVLDGVPLALPALGRAEKVLGRIERAGLVHVVDEVLAGGDAAGVGEELLALARRARAEGTDAEQALRDVVRRVEAAARAAEQDATSGPA